MNTEENLPIYLFSHLSFVPLPYEESSQISHFYSHSTLLVVSPLVFWTAAKIGHPQMPSPIPELFSSSPPPNNLSRTLVSAKLLESCSYPCIHSLSCDRGTYNSFKHGH
ncbi:hypothetical protein NPIL_113201 [Nephila pilipes]|uniref:Uncharacterized protein n=1 Tax=Nephila pilipes TaxID=299642 RepID=A0A8X6P3Z1_NEPPI|nr:hypothetical protein NPIL_113201 [Nephila pilipes]